MFLTTYLAINVVSSINTWLSLATLPVAEGAHLLKDFAKKYIF